MASVTRLRLIIAACVGIFTCLLVFLSWSLIVPACMDDMDASEPSSLISGAKPDVVWIVLDALRSQNLQCYGYDRETSPNIDHLAREGVLFEQHFTQGSWTMESFNSYISGRYFSVNSLDSGNYQDQMRTPAPDEAILPEILSNNGYKTAAFLPLSWFTPFCRFYKAIKYPLPVEKDIQSFCEFLDNSVVNHVNSPGTDSFTAGKSGSADTEVRQPFFAYFHLLDTHFPHKLEPPFNKWVDPDYVSKRIVDGVQPDRPTEAFTSEERDLLVNLYDGGVLQGDWRVGRILSELRDRDLLENTLVIISSDHGEILGEDGFTVGHDLQICDEIMRVPLIMCGPGIPQGVRSSQITENVDIVPTLVDLLHLETSATFDGITLTPLWKAPVDPAYVTRDYAFMRIFYAKDTINFVQRGSQYAYVYDPIADTGELYAEQFNIGTLLDVSSTYPEVASSLKNRIVESIMPKWEQFKNLPEKLPTEPFQVKPSSSNADLQDVLTTYFGYSGGEQKQTEEHGWLLEDGTVIFRGSGDVTPPPLTLQYDLPDGRYQILAPLKSDSPEPPTTECVLEMKMQEETDFKAFPMNLTETCVLNLGEYSISSGTFRLTLSPVKDCPFRLDRLIVVPVGGQSAPEAVEVLLNREEALRSLGYF